MAESAPDPTLLTVDEGTPRVSEGTPSAFGDFGTPISRDEDPLSKRVTLADLSARGATLYAHKQYEDATEIFSRASVLQAEINGETAPENAEILFHYGRSLFKVGQSKSDVLGGNAPTEKKTKASGSSSKTAAPKTEAQKVTQEGLAIAAGQSSETAEAEKKKEDKPKEGGAEEKKPLFQFTGDENFDDASDEEVRYFRGENYLVDEKC